MGMTANPPPSGNFGCDLSLHERWCTCPMRAWRNEMAARTRALVAQYMYSEWVSRRLEREAATSNVWWCQGVYSIANISSCRIRRYRRSRHSRRSSGTIKYAMPTWDQRVTRQGHHRCGRHAGWFSYCVLRRPTAIGCAGLNYC